MTDRARRAVQALLGQIDTQRTAMLAERVVLGDLGSLRAFATGLDARGLRRRIFHHPIAGPLHMVAALRLLSAHLLTHHRQLWRLQR